MIPSNTAQVACLTFGHGSYGAEFEVEMKPGLWLPYCKSCAEGMVRKYGKTKRQGKSPSEEGPDDTAVRP